MSYIGSTPTTQSFIAGTDYFNGTGSAVNFTLSRSVNSVNDIEVIVNNVEQIPSGYSVSGTTLTFSAAPSAGTSNVYVRYLSTTNLSLAIPAGTSATFNTVTATTVNTTALTVTNGASIQGLTVGRGAGAVATNTAVGASALNSNTTGPLNVAVGNLALNANTTGEQNTAIGASALAANTTGTNNVAIGYVALTANTTAGDNTAIGVSALNSNTTGTGNHGFGRSALRFNTTGNYNTGVGMDALRSNTTASNNTAVGYQAGYTNTTGSENVFVGQTAGYNNTTGTLNTFVGYNSGAQITTGTKNSILGRYNGNQGGLDIRTASNYIVLSDGDGNPRGYFDGGGSLLFTTARASARGLVDIPSVGGTQSVVLAISRGGDAGTMVNFYSTAATTTTIGTIGNSGNTNTTYNTSSDYRLKENIVPMAGALDTVAALKPVTWNWKSTGADGQGFIAHELAEVVPDCVTGEKDAVDGEGNPVHQGVDTSYLVATLTAAIQEQQALITALTTRITALENNNATQ
jgi:hypothetical protein